MIRDIDPKLKAKLEAGATTLCRCWRLRRKDGVVMGFTDHDRPITFEGTEFRADTGLDASALQTGNGLSVDNAQAAGALSDVGISEPDLIAGRYDAADVDQWLVDWTDPKLRYHLFSGVLGEIRRTEISFEAELRGLTEKLNVTVGRTIKRTCDAVLGDGRCRVDLSDGRFRHETTVAKVEPGGRLTVAVSGSFPAGWFRGGTVQWRSGLNNGLTGVIWHDLLLGSERVIQLTADPGCAVALGDSLTLTAGCDRLAETCRTKFDNFINFRGFPHIPGEDWVVAYPRQGETHDGSSLGRF